MTDEKFCFVSDVRDKKRTARGAFNKRSHAGKGGRVKLPSDFLSNKEIKAMSGEVKSYRLNEPMGWQEFKSMPDDIKITYIKLLREKFDVPDRHIADMMGVAKSTFCIEIKKLNIGMEARNARRKWDQNAFNAWRHGMVYLPIEKEEEPVEETVEETVEEVSEEPCEGEAVAEYKIVRAIPCEGDMTFVCNADEALETVRNLLGNAYAKITVSWELAGSDE